MACYGVDTSPIENLAARLRDVPEESLFNLAPNAAKDFSERYFQTNREIASMYLQAFYCFLTVMRAVMRQKLVLLAGSNEIGRYAHLQGFLPVYDRALGRVEQFLSAWLTEFLGGNAEAYAQFVRELVASGTAEEMEVYTTSVQTRKDLEAVDAHGASGYTVENSIKDFIRDMLNRSAATRVPLIRRGFQALNEVIGILFPALR